MVTGIIYVLISAALLGIIPVIQKQLLVTGLPNYTLFLYTDIAVLGFNYVMARVKGYSLKIKMRQLLQCILMAAMGQLLTGICLSISYMHTSVAISTMLNFLYPAIVCVAMLVIEKKKMNSLQAVAIVCSIVGMGALTGLQGEISFIGIGTALLSAFTYSAYLILSDIGDAGKIPVNVRMVYIAITAIIGYLGLSAVSGCSIVPLLSPANWMLLIGGSGILTAISFFLMLSGINLLGASTASFLSVLEPITTVVIGTLWFGDAIGFGTISGGILLLVSMVLITLNDRKNE